MLEGFMIHYSHSTIKFQWPLLHNTKEHDHFVCPIKFICAILTTVVICYNFIVVKACF